MLAPTEVIVVDGPNDVTVSALKDRKRSSSSMVEKVSNGGSSMGPRKVSFSLKKMEAEKKEEQASHLSVAAITLEMVQTSETLIPKGFFPDLEGKMHPTGEVGQFSDLLYGTNFEQGLTEVEAERRLKIFGHNELPEVEKNLCWLLCLEFLQPMAIIVWIAILIECIAAILDDRDGHTGDRDSAIADVIVLFILQLLNVFVGFIEEMKVRRNLPPPGCRFVSSLPAMFSYLSPTCHVSGLFS